MPKLEETSVETQSETTVEAPAKKPKKKPSAKKQSKPKSEKASKPKPVAKPAKLDSNMKEGSTRARMFKALKKYPNGLTANQIKERTGMLPSSGHLGVLLIEEYNSGRIRAEQHDIDGQDVFVYLLTAKGKKDIADGKIGGRSGSTLMGSKWTPKRRKAETHPKPSKKAKAKK